MQGIECEKELFLGSFLARQKMYIIDKQDVHLAVPVLEFVGNAVPDGVDQLVYEAFCRYIAIKRRELGKDTYFAGTEIDTFNSVVNALQRKYLHHIHKAIAF